MPTPPGRQRQCPVSCRIPPQLRLLAVLLDDVGGKGQAAAPPPAGPDLGVLQTALPQGEPPGARPRNRAEQIAASLATQDRWASNRYKPGRCASARERGDNQQGRCDAGPGPPLLYFLLQRGQCGSGHRQARHHQRVGWQEKGQAPLRESQALPQFVGGIVQAGCGYSQSMCASAATT